MEAVLASTYDSLAILFTNPIFIAVCLCWVIFHAFYDIFIERNESYGSNDGDVYVCFDVEATGRDSAVNKVKAIGLSVFRITDQGRTAKFLEKHLLAFKTQRSDFDDATWNEYWTRDDIAPTLMYFESQSVQHGAKSGGKHLLRLLGQFQHKYNDFTLGCDNPAYDVLWINALLNRGLGERGIEYRRTPLGSHILTKSRTGEDGKVRVCEVYKSIVDYKSLAMGWRTREMWYFSITDAKRLWWEKSKNIKCVPHDHRPENDATNILLNFFDAMPRGPKKIDMSGYL